VNAKKLWEIALGIVTSVGGFIEVGAIATASQSGAHFRFQLIWPIVLGTLCVICLIEMSGRLAAIGHHPLPMAVRERFGVRFVVWPVVFGLIVDLLVLASEIGGVCIACQLVTGIKFQWWAIPVGFFVWAAIWYDTFDRIEYGISFLGLITLVFVVGAFHVHPPIAEVARGLLPTLPKMEATHYWFLAVSTIGSIIAPYLLNFYSSGAVEDKWDESYLIVNRLTAGLGMSFGMIVQIGVLIVAAMILYPRGIRVERYEQAPLALAGPFGIWGFYLFAAALGIACFGAAIEVSMDSAYVLSQVLGWNWGKSEKPAKNTRFNLTYTLFIIPASLIILIGTDPLKLTLFSMAVTTLILPLVVLPFLVLMNDPRYLGKHTNGFAMNIAVFVIIILTFLLAIVAIPLEIAGGS
jgi:Mn2+/Fe2+ NRAMP family transporter